MTWEHLGSSGIIWIIWDDLESFGIICAHLGLWITRIGHIWDSRIIWVHRSCGILWDHLGLRITWDHLGSGIIRAHLGSSGLIWDHLGSALKESAVIWDHLESRGTIWKVSGKFLGDLWEVSGRSFGSSGSSGRSRSS